MGFVVRTWNQSAPLVTQASVFSEVLWLHAKYRDLSLNTKRLPSNKKSPLQVLVYVNAEKACSLSTSLRVDNVAPRVLEKAVRHFGSKWIVTIKPNEAVHIFVYAKNKLLRVVPAHAGKSISISVSTKPTAVILVDRARNPRWAGLSSR